MSQSKLEAKQTPFELAVTNLSAESRELIERAVQAYNHSMTMQPPSLRTGKNLASAQAAEDRLKKTVMETLGVVTFEKVMELLGYKQSITGSVRTFRDKSEKK
ncbi:MAG: hypothetical protein V1936_02995 [Patescibacteria group bacterium]